MQRIKMLLQKINEIAHKGDKATLIEIDLMMDYTRVLYADIAEIRSKLTFRTEVPDVANNPMPVKVEEPIQEIIEQPVQEQAVTTTTPVVTIPEPIIKANKAPIEKLIGINDKYQFISELFNNNTELYDTTIKEVGDFDSNQQAIDWLNANFKWDSENETVQSFFSIINRHYTV
ncbi:MAG TPA: hypothetical protein VK167_01260 [Flavipsychrobacter sp.]|nr:hypothetical protein [Flavipsychrobacter sp.]